MLSYERPTEEGINSYLEKGLDFILYIILDTEWEIKYPLVVSKATRENPIQVPAEQEGKKGVEYNKKEQKYYVYEGIVLRDGLGQISKEGILALWSSTKELVDHINQNCPTRGI